MAKKPRSRKSAAKSRDKLKIGKRTLKDLGAKGEDVKGGALMTQTCMDCLAAPGGSGTLSQLCRAITADVRCLGSKVSF